MPLRGIADDSGCLNLPLFMPSLPMPPATKPAVERDVPD